MGTIFKLDYATKKKILFLFLFSFVEFVCYVIGLFQLGGIISLVLLYITVFWDTRLPLCVYIITHILGTSLIGAVSTINAIYLSMLALNSIYQNINNSSLRKYIYITLYFFVVLFISYATGINSHLDFAVKMVVTCLIVLQIASCGAQDRILIISAVLCSGISMALIVLVSIYSGVIDVDRSVSLKYDDNSKTLSTAIAPVIFSAVYLILFGRGKKKVLTTIGLFIVVAVLSYLLVLTYSRGVLIALIISLIYLIFRYMERWSIRNYFFIALFISIAYFFISNLQFDSDMMFENTEGANGRTEIWASFIQQLKDTNSLAFGFGPGFTKDISLLGYYSHSTVLDYLFCYGIAGFLYLLYLLLKVTFNLFKKSVRSYYYQGLFILSFIMFSTHGSAGTLLFNVVLGLCMNVIAFDSN